MLDELLELFERDADERRDRRAAGPRQGGVRGFFARLFGREEQRDPSDADIRREGQSRSRADDDDDDDDYRDEARAGSSRRRRRRDDRDDAEGGIFDTFGD
jgi:hypothetical protein